MHKVDAVIFDWAGTTVDYGSFAPVRAFMEVLRNTELNRLWKKSENLWEC